MKMMMRTGDSLDAVGDTHRILVLAQTPEIMEVNPQTEVTL